MKLKSEIARPRVYEMLAPNQPIYGLRAAWAGETQVTENRGVSTDGGQTWAKAEFIDPAERYARGDVGNSSIGSPPTRQVCTPPSPWHRARDDGGNCQPEKHDPSYGTYVINHPLPIEVFVRDS